jgi:hypothetical protein
VLEEITVLLYGAPAAIRPFPAATVKPKLGGYACTAVDPLNVLRSVQDAVL